MAGGFGAASLPLLSSIALLAGGVLLLLGFVTSSWAYDGTNYQGLWRYGNCAKPDHRDCYYYDQPSIMNAPGWLHLVRALECCAMVSLAIPLVTIPVYMYVALGMYYRCMMGWMSGLSLLSSITGLIGAIVYATNMSENDWELGWSLLCVIVGCACVFIGFLILLVSMISKRPASVTEPYYPTTIFVDPKKNKLYTIRLEEDE